MRWNWQKDDWPNFHWNAPKLAPFEAEFLRQSGVVIGSRQYCAAADIAQLMVEIITDEAVKTSEIEGEYLNRASVQSSIRRNFGLQANRRHSAPAEQGIADMLVDVYRNYAAPLSRQMLSAWYAMLTAGRRDIKVIGHYRTDGDPMQVVSGPVHAPKIHFEAPPARAVAADMRVFLAWFARTAPGKAQALSPLIRAGIAHLYFVSIHPFEDGNGRIARAIAEKTLAQGLGQPTLIALSQVMQRKRKAYYAALERNNKTTEITDWLVYFAKTVLEAQAYTQRMIDFLIAKTRLYDRIKGYLNARQDKVVTRMFREGLNGFIGGLSAENYMSITGTSRATATRDLQELVALGALQKTGTLKSTRYHLNIPHSTR